MECFVYFDILFWYLVISSSLECRWGHASTSDERNAALIWTSWHSSPLAFFHPPWLIGSPLRSSGKRWIHARHSATQGRRYTKPCSAVAMTNTWHLSNKNTKPTWVQTMRWINGWLVWKNISDMLSWPSFTWWILVLIGRKTRKPPPRFSMLLIVYDGSNEHINKHQLVSKIQLVLVRTTPCKESSFLGAHLAWKKSSPFPTMPWSNLSRPGLTLFYLKAWNKNNTICVKNCSKPKMYNLIFTIISFFLFSLSLLQKKISHLTASPIPPPFLTAFNPSTRSQFVRRPRYMTHGTGTLEGALAGTAIGRANT